MNLEKLSSIEPFAVGYLCAKKHTSPTFRIASGLYNLAKELPVAIDPKAYFAGEDSYTVHYGVDTRYCTTIVFNQEKFDKSRAAHPEYAEELDYIEKQMAPLDTGAIYESAISEHENKLRQYRACWGGEWGGHGNPNYDALLSLGTEGLMRKIELYREQNPGKDDFYDALTLSLQALEIWADRYADRARECAEGLSGAEKEHMLRIADALTHCPRGTPRDFFEACQMFWIAFVFMGVDSPGRFDQFMYPYYDPENKEEARRCVEELWELFYQTRAWNLCIGGSDENGRDVSNDLSYLVLKTAAKYKYNTPNLTMRVHENTPDALLDAAIDAIATGIGMPALYNDACVCPSLEALGIPPHDAHDYCMNGCNQIDIMGKSHMGLEDGEVSLIKCLELALRDGVCSCCGELLGLRSGDAATFASYEELYRAYERQVEYVTDHAVEMANKGQRLYAKYAPNPFRSCLIDGCIEKGRDYKDGGPLYNHGQILAEGIADTADSLCAIKHFVFDTKKYTMQELLAALDADFEGYHELYRDFCSYKRFGNDEGDVDGIAQKIVTHFFQYLHTKKTYRGGIYTGGCSPFKRVALYGAKVGAMPNGKRKGDPILADSIGATPGSDRSGLTALLNSALVYPHHLAGSGFILNLKLQKFMLEKQRGKDALKALVRAYFADGGQQLSLTAVSPEELADARVHPERHRDLIVRVGGYSDYFVNLTPELQDNILRRSHYFS